MAAAAVIHGKSQDEHDFTRLSRLQLFGSRSVVQILKQLI